MTSMLISLHIFFRQKLAILNDSMEDAILFSASYLWLNTENYWQLCIMPYIIKRAKHLRLTKIWSWIILKFIEEYIFGCHQYQNLRKLKRQQPAMPLIYRYVCFKAIWTIPSVCPRLFVVTCLAANLVQIYVIAGLVVGGLGNPVVTCLHYLKHFTSRKLLLQHNKLFGPVRYITNARFHCSKTNGFICI